MVQFSLHSWEGSGPKEEPKGRSGVDVSCWPYPRPLAVPLHLELLAQIGRTTGTASCTLHTRATCSHPVIFPRQYLPWKARLWAIQPFRHQGRPQPPRDNRRHQNTLNQSLEDRGTHTCALPLARRRCSHRRTAGTRCRGHTQLSQAHTHRAPHPEHTEAHMNTLLGASEAAARAYIHRHVQGSGGHAHRHIHHTHTCSLHPQRPPSPRETITAPPAHWAGDLCSSLGARGAQAPRALGGEGTESRWDVGGGWSAGLGSRLQAAGSSGSARPAPRRSGTWARRGAALGCARFHRQGTARRLDLRPSGSALRTRCLRGAASGLAILRARRWRWRAAAARDRGSALAAARRKR